MYTLRYSTVISDGETKTVTMLNNEKVYGDDVVIVKYEYGGACSEACSQSPSEAKEQLCKKANRLLARLLRQEKAAESSTS